jgi:hypothetical protein
MTIQPPGTDPRKAGGTIAGPGDPHERNAVVIDATNAVLMDHMTVALIEPIKDGKTVGTKPYWCMNLEGRINKTQDRSRVNYLFDVDGAAAIITELLAMASRSGMMDALDEHIDRRMEKMARAGHL